jgi:hypothetical protein
MVVRLGRVPLSVVFPQHLGLTVPPFRDRMVYGSTSLDSPNETEHNMQVMYTVGLNMRCHKVVCEVTLLERRAPNSDGLDCVILTDGIRMLSTYADLYATCGEAEAALTQ